MWGGRGRGCPRGCHATDGVGPKGGYPNPEEVGTGEWRARRVEGPKISRFFPSPADRIRSFLLSGGLLVEFWWCFRIPGPSNGHVWSALVRLEEDQVMPPRQSTLSSASHDAGMRNPHKDHPRLPGDATQQDLTRRIVAFAGRCHADALPTSAMN